MLQLLGACMILLGSMGLGYSYIERERKIICVIEKWEHIMQMFISEITYKKQPLSYACRVIGEKAGGEEGRCLKKVAERMQEKNRLRFGEIWNEEFQKYGGKQKITEELQNALMEFGVLSGFEDEEIQIRMIEGQQEKWKTLRIKKQKEHQERKKLITTLSFSMGLMLVLILW